LISRSRREVRLGTEEVFYCVSQGSFSRMRERE
jgi:hypothetical protein